MHDVRLALRQLVKLPGLSIVAILILALGIGANTAIFSAIHTLFLRPLAFPEPERIVRVFGSFPDRGLDQAPLSYPRYETLRDQQTVFTEFAAQAFTGFTYTGKGDPEQVLAQRVSDRFFAVLGVAPLLGRTFTPEDDRPGAPPVVLLSHGWWQERFAADPAIVGQAITLDGTPCTVIGVLPASFGFPFQQTQVWAAKPFEPEGIGADLIRRGTGYLLVSGRLKPGITPAAVDEQLALISSRYSAEFPDKVDAKAGIRGVAFLEDLVGNQRPTFLVLLAAVAFVLLIACANVSNLLLVRLASRQKEIAVRNALGASRGQLLRQFLTESLVLSAAAGLLGIGVALGSVRLLSRVGADFIPRAAEIGINAPVLLFSLALSTLIGVAIGLVPAFQATRRDWNATLKESSRGTTAGRSAGRVRAALFIGEVAVSLVLLVGASLLLRSFTRLQGVPLGFVPRQLAVFNLGISPRQYPDIARQSLFFEQVLERLRAIPGVTKASATSGLPIVGGFARSPFVLEGSAAPPVNERQLAVRSTLAPGYFATLGIPLRQGRDFTWRDREGATNAVIVNESMARRLFPGGESPLGRRLITGIQSIPREIVGVVGDTRSQGFAQAPQDEMYYPTAQLGDLFLSIVLQSERPASSLRGEVQAAVHEIDRGIPVNEVRPLDALLAQSVSDRRLVVGLVGGFAALALLLAALGIYSVIAYGVSQRKGEIGVRMALGADPRSILALVLKEGLRLTALGLAIGLAAAAGLTRLLRSQLFEVSATDPLVYSAVTGFLVAISLLACLMPARRASQVDPLEALRTD
ncbi:MAG TPA: ABC transporter permease [Candidatus Polarisedimenticolaceae bacterium]|nr:ABC transporter permease [Candidatus Polarisedimenticolaceae bacterium]